MSSERRSAEPRPYGFMRGPTRTSRGRGAREPADVQQPGAVFRVGSYNVCGGKGRDGRRDWRRAATVLEHSDLVGLQEVAGPGHVARLGDLLQMRSLYLPAETRWFRDYRGNGLVSRLPVGDWSIEPMPIVRHKGFRSLAEVQVGSGDGAFSFFVTHVSKHEDRERHLETILTRFAERERAILLGDFNTRRDHPLLSEHLTRPGNTDALSLALGADDRERRIDWILTRGFQIRGGGIDDSDISDHPYVWVDVEPDGRDAPAAEA